MTSSRPISPPDPSAPAMREEFQTLPKLLVETLSQLVLAKAQLDAQQQAWLSGFMLGAGQPSDAAWSVDLAKGTARRMVPA